jgi:rfaE bifunctional protein kinase chain/domain
MPPPTPSLKKPWTGLKLPSGRYSKIVKTQDIEKIFEGFSQSNILVIGDIMVDAYLWGKVERISPEAPVPVVSVEKKETRLGGAANVALNLKALGATPFICATYGTDESGRNLLGLFRENGLSAEGLQQVDYQPTTVKTRVITAGQHVLRIDEEDIADISPETERSLLQRVNDIVSKNKIHAIIFEDYNKGLLTEKLITDVIALARQHGIVTAVDPKKKNFLSYKNVDLFKPNLKELREGMKVDIDKASKAQIDEAVTLLNSHINARIAFITLSEYGVYLRSDEFCGIVPAHRREIADVSGAGDTVISVAALCLAQGLPHQVLAEISNLAGGLVCEEVGVVPIGREKLLAELLKLAE